MDLNTQTQKVIPFENFISSNKVANSKEGYVSETESTDLQHNLVPKGKRKSGKFWKTSKTRANSIIKTKGLQLSLDKRKKIQEDVKLAKQLTRNALEERKRLKEEHRQRRVANLKKHKENQKKAEIVQVIKNPSKVKKKHLRMIEKRDTLPFLNKTSY